MDNILESVAEITELNEISRYMNDKDLDEALAVVIKLIMKPDIPATKAPEVIVKLQALSAKFSMQKRFYMTFEKGADASIKKNVYATASDAIDKVVDSLKYIARYGA